MKIITFREFKGLALCGEVEIPVGTAFETSGWYVIFDDGRHITRLFSDNFCKHFARNDDGNGLERGKLTYEVAYAPRGNGGSRLTEDEADFLRREWSKYLMPYKDTILFNNSFFDAPIEDLRLIAAALNIGE